jgi:hypothetical protein
MLKLCLRDFLACRWLWLLAFIAFAGYTLSPMGRISLAYILLGGVLAFGCVLITAAVEDRFKTETFVASLPVRRPAVVAGRYLTAGLLTLAAGAVVFGALAPQSRLPGFDRAQMDPRLMLSVDGAAGYLLFVILLVALFLPFYFGLGLGRGSAWFSGALMAVSAILYAVTRVLGFGAGGGQEIFNLSPGRDIGGAFIRMIGSIRAGLGDVVFILAALTVTAAAVGSSLALSVLLYEKREL